MKKKLVWMIAAFLFVAATATAQIREIPKIVEETFANQYKDASNIEFKDELVRVDVSFELEGEKMLATYSNKGVWKETKKQFDFSRLPAEVKDGFDKSKYADRTVEETVVIYLPGGGEQYRVLAKKSDVEKKYLYFNTKGRLLRTSITL
jgi:putative PepSY-like beta-lactamase-inhibitor